MAQPSWSRAMRSASAISAATSEPPGPGSPSRSRERRSLPVVRRQTGSSGPVTAPASTATSTRPSSPVGRVEARAAVGVDSGPAPASVQVATAYQAGP